MINLLSWLTWWKYVQRWYYIFHLISKNKLIQHIFSMYLRISTDWLRNKHRNSFEFHWLLRSNQFLILFLFLYRISSWIETKKISLIKRKSIISRSPLYSLHFLLKHGSKCKSWRIFCLNIRSKILYQWMLSKIPIYSLFCSDIIVSVLLSLNSISEQRKWNYDNLSIWLLFTMYSMLPYILYRSQMEIRVNFYWRMICQLFQVININHLLLSIEFYLRAKDRKVYQVKCSQWMLESPYVLYISYSHPKFW